VASRKAHTASWDMCLCTADPSCQGQAAHAPVTVVLSDITSLADLAAAFKQHDPAGTEYRHSLNGSSLIRVIVECDLHGRSMTANSCITIPPAFKLRLLNGTVYLSEGVIIGVSPGAALEMVRLTVYGTESFEGGLVNVQGQGATALLQQCTIIGPVQERGFSSGHAVRVSQGGYVALDRCWLSKAAHCGLSVEGQASTAYARSCFAEWCLSGGYTARDGGHLTAERSVAANNRQSGFYARGKGSIIWAREGCRAEKNKGAGFLASRAGELVAGCGCVAKDNSDHGFFAYGLGSSMQVGPGCVAEHRTGADHLRFKAAQGGVLLMPSAQAEG
jgi:hypothetical protein